MKFVSKEALSNPWIIATGSAIIATVLTTLFFYYFLGIGKSGQETVTNQVMNSVDSYQNANSLSIEINADTKILSITNESDATTSLSIYGTSFDLGNLIVDNKNHEFVPENAITNFSTLGFEVEQEMLAPQEEKDFDLKTFSLVTFTPWNGTQDPDANLYCFFVDAKNFNGQESFYPVITSQVEFISGFDNPLPENSGEGGGYDSAVGIESVKNQIETQCENLYRQTV